MFEYPFSPQYLTLDGHRLHYINEGKGPVIVMLHGNPSWSYLYRHAIKALSNTHRVIVPDHMGCGLSDKPQRYPYCLQQHIDNLAVLLKTLGVNRYSLLVHDWGGAIGMGYAVKEPHRVEKIVLLNTAAFRSTRIPLRIRICRWPYIGTFIIRALNGFAGAAGTMAVERDLPAKVAEAFVEPYSSWQNRVAVNAFVKDIPLSSDHPSYGVLKGIEDRLCQLQGADIPKLIVWGGKDFCFDKVFYDEWCRRFPEARRRYFQDAGHYVLEDERDAILEILQDFFNNSSLNT